MKIHDTSIYDLYLIEQGKVKDLRGYFLKLFNEMSFKQLKLESELKEVLISVSNLNTIRGMHFQLPPFAQIKIVTVLHGKILDVVLDLRKDSPTYGKYERFTLSVDEPFSLYVGKGLAHGFLASAKDSMVCYLTTELYYEKYDSGIRWNSFGFDWNVTSPIISEKDQKLPSFDEFKSPYSFKIYNGGK